MTARRVIKVRVPITVEIDVDAWRTDYGLESITEVREDVQRHITNSVQEHLRDLGMLA